MHPLRLLIRLDSFAKEGAKARILGNYGVTLPLGSLLLIHINEQ